METGTGVNNTVVSVDNSDGKRQKCSGIELEDRLGNLPDSILVHILSFLPTRDAVKTVIISRFGYLWTSTHNLDFSWCSYHDCEDIDYENEDNRCLNLIRHALILHARPTIYKFSLNFAFTFSRNWHEYEDQEIQDDEEYIREMQLANEINTWIRFAVTKEVKILNVDLKACRFVELECCYKLPKFVLSSCYLTDLRLVACALNPGMNVRMKSLKILSLSNINLSDELMNTIFSGCPLLEDLYLSSCPGLHKLNFTSPCSKKLAILLDVDDKKLEISCATVTSLNVSGLQERVELKNVLSVVDAVFLFSYNYHGYKKDYLGILRLFMKLHHGVRYMEGDQHFLRIF